MAKNKAIQRVHRLLKVPPVLDTAIVGAANSANLSVTEWILSTCADRLEVTDWRLPERRGKWTRAKSARAT